MPDAQIQPVLADAAIEILERMFFLSAMPVEEAPADAGATLVRLAFEGDPPGRLFLLMSDQAAASITANFHGKEPSAVNGQQIAEVGVELANMICGAVLSRVESTATFHLRTPEVLPGEPAISPDCHFVHLETGEGTLSIFVETETAICRAAQESAF